MTNSPQMAIEPVTLGERINLCRTRPSRPQAEPEYSSWSFTDGGFHKPEKFGVMVFM